jgi:uncharacterized protein YukE
MSFKVNIVELDNLGKAVTNDGDLAEQEVKKIFSIIDALEQGWSGPDNKQFVQRIHEKKPTLDALVASIRNCGQFCSSASNKIKRVQDESSSAASRI